MAAARVVSIHRFPTRDLQIKEEKEGISFLNPKQMLLSLKAPLLDHVNRKKT